MARSRESLGHGHKSCTALMRTVTIACRDPSREDWLTGGEIGEDCKWFGAGSRPGRS